MNNCQQLAQEIRAGNRRALSRAITLAESTHRQHRNDADSLFDILSAADIRQSLRIAFTGAPGVGKSTLINALGLLLTHQGMKVAVLAVDPTSAHTGGSILGDKTRMDILSRERLSYIRPSPSRHILGGVAKHTREVIFLCEQAGYDFIFVETTGVGQSETKVGQLTDIFVLLVAPAAGDELQGVKRGIMELADIIAVTKADGALKDIARQTAAEYQGALRLFARRDKDPEKFPLTCTVSVQETATINRLWQSVVTLGHWRQSHGMQKKIRIEQDSAWIHSRLHEEIVKAIEMQTDINQKSQQIARIITTTGTAFSPEVRGQLRTAIDSSLSSIQIKSKEALSS